MNKFKPIIIPLLLIFIALFLWTIYWYSGSFYIKNKIHSWSKLMMLTFKKLDGLDWVVIAEDKIPKGAFIVASKHQSVWDTIFFTAYFNDAAMVLKKILIYIPAYGWHALKAKMIWVDRKGGGKALKHLLNEAEEAKKIGRPIVIFPEGTRVKV